MRLLLAYASWSLEQCGFFLNACHQTLRTYLLLYGGSFAVRRLKLDDYQRMMLDETILRTIFEHEEKSSWFGYRTKDEDKLFARVRALICQGGRAVASDCDTKKTALHHAARQRNWRLFRFLLEFGEANVNQKDAEGSTPLHHIAAGGIHHDESTVKILDWVLSRGADIQSQNVAGETPLFLACMRKPWTPSEDSIDIADWEGDPWQQAREWMSSEPILGVMIASLCGAFDQDNTKKAAASIVGIYQNARNILEPMDLLLERGARHPPAGENGQTLLHILAGTTVSLIGEKLERLLPAPILPSKIDVRDNQGWSPLHTACHAGNRPAIRWFLERGACLDARTNEEGNTPLHLACMQGHTKVLPIMISHGASAAALTCRGESCFALACRYDQIDVMVALYVESHSDYVNAPVRGETCLHRESRDVGRTQMGRALLLSFGANANLTDIQGKTALDIAFEFKHWELVPFLIYREAKSSATLRSREIYALYKNATQIFLDFQNAHAPAYLRTNKTVLNIRRTAEYLASKRLGIPEVVFAHLVTAIKLRGQESQRRRGGDANHKFFLKALKDCQVLLKPLVKLEYVGIVPNGCLDIQKEGFDIQQSGSSFDDGFDLEVAEVFVEEESSDIDYDTTNFFMELD